MHQEVHFSVDCEWVCNLARERVYYEGLPFSDGIKLLADVFSIEDNIAMLILTGQKKIVGINEGELVDDNKTQDYLDYIARQEGKALKATIREDVKLHPLNYIDPFATIRSINKFEDKMNGRVPGQRELEDWFICGSAEKDYVLCGGLYSINEAVIPFLVKTDDDKEKFYNYLYDYWKKELATNEYPDNIKKNIELRQKKYELWLDKRNQVELFDVDDLIEYYNSRSKEISFVISKDNTYNFCDGSEAYYQRNAKYIPCEEGTFSKYGLISPTGDFYACDYASHKVAAGKLCQQFGYFEGRPKQLGWYITDDEEDRAKDILYNRGWVFVNTNWAGTFYSKYGALEDMPQKVMDTAYDFMIWERTING